MATVGLKAAGTMAGDLAVGSGQCRLLIESRLIQPDQKAGLRFTGLSAEKGGRGFLKGLITAVLGLGAISLGLRDQAVKSDADSTRTVLTTDGKPNVKDKHPIALGIYAGEGPDSMARIKDMEHRFGRPFPLIHHYTGMGESFAHLRQKSLDTAEHTQTMQLISWAPGVQSGVLYEEIAAGKQDAYFHQWAKEAKAWGKPFFLRFAYEMNWKHMSWCADRAENGGADAFVKAWRRIHDIFKAEGVNTARWVWCPHVDEHNPAYTEMMQYYPGDEYVDWIGMDAYNGGRQGTEKERIESVDWLFKDAYQRIESRYKPIMIAEIATDSRVDGAEQWIRTAFNHFHMQYPLVQALVYFDMDYRSQSPLEKDWRFSDKPPLRDVFGELMHASGFEGNKDTLLNPFTLKETGPSDMKSGLVTDKRKPG